jgi:hypothetical protein
MTAMDGALEAAMCCPLAGHRFDRGDGRLRLQGGTSRLLCLCPLWVKMGRGGPAASVTRAIALPVAALRLWQRTTVGEFYGELSTPAPEIWGQWPLRSSRFPVQLEVLA